MPIPKPKTGESQEEFISRCMSNTTMVEEYNQKVRAGICFTAWKNKEDNVDGKNNPEDDKIIKVQRFDFLPLVAIKDMKSDLEIPFRRTTEGFLKGRSIITNIGVFPYLNADGTIRKELRIPEEVLKMDSLNSILMKPITNEHPNEKVDVDNIKRFQVGFTGSEFFNDAYHVAADITITDKKAIKEVNDGKRALSAGYELTLEKSPGTWMGIDYDYIQKDIKYNHIAIVDRGRAGDAARMRMDSLDLSSAYYIGWNNDNNISKKEDDNMPNLKIVKLDGVEYQAEGEVIKELNQAKDHSKSLQTEIDQLKKDSATIEAERDTLNDRVDQLEKELEEVKNDTSKIDAAVKERLIILDAAEKADVEVKEDMAAIEIKKAVIMKVFPAANLDGKDDVYISARFDGAVELLVEKIEKNNDAKKREVKDIQPKDETKPSSTKSREDMINRMREQSRKLPE